MIEEIIRGDEEDRPANAIRSFVIHYASESTIERIGRKFLIDPNVLPEFHVRSIGNGMAINWERAEGFFTPLFRRSPLVSPEIFSASLNELFFVGDGDCLNEFGHYYIALYIAGMITRYFPHIWIKEMRINSPAAVLIDELVEHSIDRVPLLAASALERAIYIYD
ncbi:YaaC family protein [Rhizobium laguerreae]|uniref:YaaC family protein n=1 Tax=Rhizobium laguerreae TaxID=1076926 RepID=UPI001C9291C4|nr:hypothetical protein [Rhizobium laguerreae]MBY3564151.1 hypothetical protein [Rhizobium laguerreae]